MNPQDVLLDILQNFSAGLHRTLADLPDEAMQWQPDPQANNIAVTVWHVCRALDVLKVRIVDNRPDTGQLWYLKGWAAQTGYDPAGLGFGGFGNLAGYTLEQVKAVPLLTASQSLEYFDQVYAALEPYLAALEPDGLQQPPPGWPRRPGGSAPESIYVVFLMFLLDNREHLGEIKAIKAQWGRKNQISTPLY